MFQNAITFLASFLGLHAQAQCPDASLKETKLDCPWALVSRTLDGVTDADQIRTTMDEHLPSFMVQFERDGRSRQLLEFWGLSRNIDESNLATGLRTVPENLLRFFASIWDLTFSENFTIGHAGLTHTYGYLFSTRLTPYGYKRARYVTGELEAGFGVSDKLFSGMPRQGTLLSNLTYFTGRIAFRDNPALTTELQAAVKSGQIVNVPELTEYPFETLKVRRLVEVVTLENATLEIRTDIVHFPKTNLRGANTNLLIYSVDYRPNGAEARPRLITAFPVQQTTAKGVFEPSLLGESLPIKLNYNASLPVTISGEQMVGKRFIFNESSIPQSRNRSHRR